MSEIRLNEDQWENLNRNEVTASLARALAAGNVNVPESQQLAPCPAPPRPTCPGWRPVGQLCAYVWSRLRWHWHDIGRRWGRAEWTLTVNGQEWLFRRRPCWLKWDRGYLSVVRTKLALTVNPTSPLRLLYLAVFVVTATSVYGTLVKGATPLSAAINPAEGGYLQLFSWVFTAAAALIGAHLLRVYVTLELLEDPFSDLHRYYLLNLGPLRRRLEATLRLLIVAVVSVEVAFALIRRLTELCLEKPAFDGPSLPTVLFHLTALYALLLAWDGLLATSRPRSLLGPYFVASLVGFIVTLYATITVHASLAYPIGDHAKRIHDEAAKLSMAADTLRRPEADQVNKIADAAASVAAASERLSASIRDSNGALLAGLRKSAWSLLVAFAVLGCALAYSILYSVAGSFEDFGRFLKHFLRTVFSPHYGSPP